MPWSVDASSSGNPTPSNCISLHVEPSTAWFVGGFSFSILLLQEEAGEGMIIK